MYIYIYMVYYIYTSPNLTTNRRRRPRTERYSFTRKFAHWAALAKRSASCAHADARQRSEGVPDASSRETSAAPKAKLQSAARMVRPRARAPSLSPPDTSLCVALMEKNASSGRRRHHCLGRRRPSKRKA